MYGCEYSSNSSWARRLHSTCTGDTALLCTMSWNRYLGAASLMQPELCQLIMVLWFRNTAQRAHRITFHFPRPAMVTTTSDRGPPYTNGWWGVGSPKITPCSYLENNSVQNNFKEAILYDGQQYAIHIDTLTTYHLHKQDMFIVLLPRLQETDLQADLCGKWWMICRMQQSQCGKYSIWVLANQGAGRAGCIIDLMHSPKYSRVSFPFMSPTSSSVNIIQVW